MHILNGQFIQATGKIISCLLDLISSMEIYRDHRLVLLSVQPSLMKGRKFFYLNKQSWMAPPCHESAKPFPLKDCLDIKLSISPIQIYASLKSPECYPLKHGPINSKFNGNKWRQVSHVALKPHSQNKFCQPTAVDTALYGFSSKERWKSYVGNTAEGIAF